MNKRVSKLLQVFVLLVGVGALAFLLWEPHIEGRNVHATASQIYLNDPFLVYAYLASIPFFVALYHTFRVLGLAGERKVVSRQAVTYLRRIKFCALGIIAFVVGGEIFIWLNESDDRAGGVFMGLLITIGAIVIAVAANHFERSLKNMGEPKFVFRE